MSKSLSYVSEKTGMPPGSLVHVGEVHQKDCLISLIDYGNDQIEERIVESVDELSLYRDKESITWVVVEGLTDIGIIESIGEIFDIHPLVLEDILNTHHRPKFEEHDDFLYILLKGLSSKEGSFEIDYEQISILMFKRVVLTFRERKNSLFAPVINRIRMGNRFKNSGTDYLTYAVMDLIVDRNFSVTDSLAETIDSLEVELIENPTAATLNDIQDIKREVADLRRSIAPLRNLLGSILKSESDLVQEKTLPYFRDVLDHVLHISETVDSYRDIFSGLLDIYISSVSNRMNEIMKVLTVFASIFIPLTFIAGIYGMNFEFMPELKWRFSYPLIWVVFIAITLVLIRYFRKKGWLK